LAPFNEQAAQAETVQLLQSLLRLNTVNPPGNEIRAVQFIAETLKREGIESTILESAPGRGNLVARLKGDGRRRPFLLMGHVDVVPVEESQWIHPPFAGEIHDGFLYGRGAKDMKNVVAIELMIFMLLKRLGAPLKRDIIFMANADEEAGGIYGAKWMVENHPDLINAEYGLNEGGGDVFEIGGRKFIECQTGEKGSSRFWIRAQGTPGHASQPHADNPILHLANAIDVIGRAHLPHHVTATSRAYVEGIARQLGPDGEEWLGLLDPQAFWSTLDRLPIDYGMRRQLIATFHNTTVPTILKAGAKTNVIPSVAEATVDSRIIPGITHDEFRAELRAALPANVQFEVTGNTPGIESRPDSPLFDKIQRVIGRYVPGAQLLPKLVVGGTDARHQTKLGTQVYGFCASNAAPAEGDRVHAHNERIHVDDLLFGLKAMYDIVSEFCAE